MGDTAAEGKGRQFLSPHAKEGRGLFPTLMRGREGPRTRRGMTRRQLQDEMLEGE